MACSSDGEFDTPQSMLHFSYLGSVFLDLLIECMGSQIF
jgi:hypothetical protein